MDHKLAETIADIAYFAGYNKFTTGDSRTDIDLFIYWAKEFETMHKNTCWGTHNYMLEVDEFAQNKLKD